MDQIPAGLTPATTTTRRGWVLTGPALIWTTVFFLAPMGMVVAYSLFRRVGGSIETSPELFNYQRIFDEPVFLDALSNSLEVVLITVFVSILVAYPFAYILAYRVPPRWQRPLLLLAVLPFWTSYVVRSYSWLLVLAKNGVVNQSMVSTGLISSPLSLANTRLATVIGFVHFFSMLVSLTIYASLTQIPDSYRKAARDLGASGLRTFLRITLPLSMPGVVVGAFLTFVLAIGDFVTPQILGGGQELLLPQAIMLQVQRRGDFPLAAALSVVLLVIVIAVYAVVSKRLTLDNE